MSEKAFVIPGDEELGPSRVDSVWTNGDAMRICSSRDGAYLFLWRGGKIIKLGSGLRQTVWFGLNAPASVISILHQLTFTIHGFDRYMLTCAGAREGLCGVH